MTNSEEPLVEGGPRIVKKNYNISEMMYDFLKKGGVGAFPTVIPLLLFFFIERDGKLWSENAGFKGLPDCKVGDDLFWYKTKSIYNEGVRPSIPFVLKNSDLFKNEDENEHQGVSRVFVTKSRKYFVKAGKIYFTSLKDTIKNAKQLVINVPDFNVDSIFDMIVVDGKDYAIAPTLICKIENETMSIAYTAPRKIESACVVSDHVILAAGERGYDISNIGSSPSVTEIKRYYHVTWITRPGSGSNGTEEEKEEVIHTNNVPETGITMCYPVGKNSFVIGNSSSSGSFRLGENYSKIEAPSGTTGSKTLHYYGKPLLIRSGNVCYDGINYPVRDVNSVASMGEKTIAFATESGISFYFRGGSLYFATPKIGSNLFEANGSLYLITSNGVIRTYRANEEGHPIKVYPFNFVFDNDYDKDEIDVAEVVLDISDLIVLGSGDASIYSKKIKVKNKKETNFCLISSRYANNKHLFVLIGNDDRAKAAEELKLCCAQFNIE